MLIPAHFCNFEEHATDDSSQMVSHFRAPLASDLTLCDRGFFELAVSEGGGMRAPPHHDFVVIARMIMKFGTGTKLDVFYTMVTIKFVMSLLIAKL